MKKNTTPYLAMANNKARMIFGADLVIKENPDYKNILLSGELLGQYTIKAAETFHCPLALPYMDLKVEKEDLLKLLEVPEEAIEAFQFTELFGKELIETVKSRLDAAPTHRIKANCEALTYIRDHSQYIPVGMSIGPFSFMTKLLPEPITPVFMASMGVSSEDDPQVLQVEVLLEVATLMILRSLRMQVEAGAKAICVCEPAANNVYISPDIMTEEEGDIFDRYVIAFNQRVKNFLDENNVDYILHDCGELSNLMLKKLCKLDPVILSLGSSRKLWEDAGIVPKDIVLFGNLPTKQFFMDNVLSDEKVKQLTLELAEKMNATGHPFILGSECDVLRVEGYEDTMLKKIHTMLECC